MNTPVHKYSSEHTPEILLRSAVIMIALGIASTPAPAQTCTSEASYDAISSSSGGIAPGGTLVFDYKRRISNINGIRRGAAPVIEAWSKVDTLLSARLTLRIASMPSDTIDVGVGSFAKVELIRFDPEYRADLHEQIPSTDLLELFRGNSGSVTLSNTSGHEIKSASLTVQIGGEVCTGDWIPGKILKEKSFATTWGNEAFEIVFLQTENGYGIAKKIDRNRLAELVRVDDPRYFRVKVDDIFESLDTRDLVKLTNVAEDLFKQLNDYMRNEVIRTRLQQEALGDLLGLLQVTKKPVAVERSVGLGPLKGFSAALVGPILTIVRFPAFEKLLRAESEPEVAKLTVESVEIAFEDGAIVDMNVVGTLRGEQLQFRNRELIPVSALSAIDRFNHGDLRLVSADIERGCRSGNRTDHAQEEKCDSFVYIINPGDVVNYTRRVVGSGHYVPRNSIVRLHRDSVGTVQLRKHSFIRNFDARLYSDVTGLKVDNPNGVLQVDVRYGHIFNTKQAAKTLPFWRNVNFLHKVEPFVAFPKLQDKLTSLPVDLIESSDTTFANFVLDAGGNIVDSDTLVLRTLLGLRPTAIDVIRFANLHLGLTTTAIRYNHLSARLDIKVALGLFRTRTDTLSVTGNENVDLNDFDVVDVSLEERDALFWYWRPIVAVNFVESRRFDFDLVGSYLIMYPISGGIELEGRRGILELQANVNVHPDPNSRETSVFFRTTLFRGFGDYGTKSNSNLSLQIGYSTPISKIFGG